MMHRCESLNEGKLAGSNASTSVLLLLTLALSVGCGKSYSDRGTITGEVRLDGQPVERGSILLMPMAGTKGSPAGCEIINGRYSLSGKTGAAIGWNRVEIHASRKTGNKIPLPFPARGKMIDEEVEVIPAQFNATSTLKVEVKPGDNTANFDVTSR